MKIKKIIALMLALVSLCGIFAGCSGNGGRGDIAFTTDLEGNEYFYIDRDYVIDASQVEATEAEYAKAEAYITEQILESKDSATLGFDFKVSGVFFSEVIATYEKTVEVVDDNDVYTEWLVTYKKEGDLLEVRVEARLYKVAPVCEWTVWIENIGNANSGVITDFSGYKATIGNSDDGEYDILTFGGGRDATVSFQPVVKDLQLNHTMEIYTTGGRSSVRYAPYYNVYWNNEDASWGREGIFYSIGWTGQWRSFVTQTENGVVIDSRQEQFQTYLKPGEKVRSARMTLMFWEKDVIRAQNIWTSFMYNYIQPKEDGEPLQTKRQMNTNVYVTNLMENATNANQITGIKMRAAAGYPFDSWQMDAGWSKLFAGSWWNSVGTWEVDQARFGESLKQVSDAAHENGLDTVLWYEPERIASYSEWHNKFKGTDWMIHSEAQSCLNLANDDVLEFLCSYMKDSIEKNGVDWYRQDCNFDLLYYWEMRDNAIEGVNRVGITENKYIVNYYKYYDFLIEECGVMIDSCASGGKRLDLETQARSYPLWRDDKCNDPIVTQCQTYGINMFAPYSGQSTIETNMSIMKYVNRSNFMQCNNFVYHIEANNPVLNEAVMNAMNEHVEYSPYFLGDYYPLTPWSDTPDKWIGWQWHDREDNSGIVQMFKRQGSPVREQHVYLSGLEADAVYIITDIDTGEQAQVTGEQLMVKGMTIHIDNIQDAKIFHYEVKE